MMLPTKYACNATFHQSGTKPTTDASAALQDLLTPTEPVFAQLQPPSLMLLIIDALNARSLCQFGMDVLAWLAQQEQTTT
jgi:hypothetical protein